VIVEFLLVYLLVEASDGEVFLLEPDDGLEIPDE
jgi:hypothetical protein